MPTLSKEIPWPEHLSSTDVAHQAREATGVDVNVLVRGEKALITTKNISEELLLEVKRKLESLGVLLPI